MFKSNKFLFEVNFYCSSFALNSESASSFFLNYVNLISSTITRAIISSNMFFNLTTTFFVAEVKRWLKKFLTIFAISRFALFFAFFSFLIKWIEWSFRQSYTIITSLKQITMFKKRSRLFRLTKAHWQHREFKKWKSVQRYYKKVSNWSEIKFEPFRKWMNN